MADSNHEFFAAIDASNITGAVYGIGRYAEQAILDARAQGASGNLRVVPCTGAAFYYVGEYGGAPSKYLCVTFDGVRTR